MEATPLETVELADGTTVQFVPTKSLYVNELIKYYLKQGKTTAQAIRLAFGTIAIHKRQGIPTKPEPLIKLGEAAMRAGSTFKAFGLLMNYMQGLRRLNRFKSYRRKQRRNRRMSKIYRNKV